MDKQKIKHTLHTAITWPPLPIIYLVILFLFKTTLLNSFKVLNLDLFFPSFLASIFFLIIFYLGEINKGWGKTEILVVLYAFSVFFSAIINKNEIAFFYSFAIPITYFVGRFFGNIKSHYIWIIPIFIYFISSFPGVQSMWKSVLWNSASLQRYFLFISFILMIFLRKGRWWHYPFILGAFLCIRSRLLMLLTALLIIYDYLIRPLCEKYPQRKHILFLIPFAPIISYCLDNTELHPRVLSIYRLV